MHAKIHNSFLWMVELGVIFKNYPIVLKCMSSVTQMLKLNKGKLSSNKGPSSQGYGFSSGDGCESWTTKKAEHQRIDAF